VSIPDVLSRPNRSLPGRRKSLEAFTLYVGFRGFFETVASPGTLVFVAFVLRLGVEKEKVGLIVALVSVSAVAQLLSFTLTNRSRNRKRTILVVALGEPLLVAAMVLIVPLVPPAARLGTLAALTFAAAAMLHLTSPVKEDWLSAIIPRGLRGRYLGYRVRVYGIVCLGVLLASGQIAERWASRGTTVLALLLGSGCLFGLLSVLALRRATMPESVASGTVSLRSFGGVVRNASFMRYLVAMVVYALPFTVGAPYYQVFYLEALHLPKTTISYIYVGYWIVRLVGAPTFGKMVDRIGARRVALGSGVIYAAFFLILALSSAERVWMVIAAWTMVAVADASYNIALASALYGTVEGSGSRPAYFAVSSLASTAALAVGGLVGVAGVTALKGAHVAIGPFWLGQFHFLYLGCAALMVACTFGARLLPGRGGGRAGGSGGP
jgi:predicted MFS family arabinose efflux permease